jgi:hypothetical protein
MDRLKGGALRTFSTLIALSRSDKPQATELQDKFYEAVCDITDVRIEQFPENRGSFYVHDGILHVNEGPVAQILSTATSEFEKRSAANDLDLAASELPKLLEKIFIDFLLHEIRHCTQGVESFDVVQRLKAAAGRSAMAEIDAYADRDAAWAYASAEAGWNDRKAFLEKFREALFLSGDYYFKVFPIISTRHDKIERAISVLLMAARLARVDLSTDVLERSNLPLDAALSVTLSSERNALAIYRNEPSRRLLGVANDTDGVTGLVNDINAGRFDAALGKSVSLMNRLDLLR